MTTLTSREKEAKWERESEVPERESEFHLEVEAIEVEGREEVNKEKESEILSRLMKLVRMKMAKIRDKEKSSRT